MTYKIVKNAAGNVVAFGPDDENYEPTLKEGETISIESGKDVEAMIEQYQAKLFSEFQQIANDRAAIFDRLGLTAEEGSLLFK